MKKVFAIRNTETGEWWDDDDDAPKWTREWGCAVWWWSYESAAFETEKVPDPCEVVEFDCVEVPQPARKVLGPKVGAVEEPSVSHNEFVDAVADQLSKYLDVPKGEMLSDLCGTDPHYPDVCKNCGGPAWIGPTRVDCKAKCQEHGRLTSTAKHPQHGHLSVLLGRDGTVNRR